MNNALRRIAFFVGVGLLVVSMYWSQDGFNFDIAGDSGYLMTALLIGWFLAIAVSTVEFVFSTSFKELNPSLILFGILAYAYSIYTNHGGIVHFQGVATNQWGAWVLAVIMDAMPEPLIAWSLYESRTGDLVGNLFKALMSAPDRFQQSSQQQNNGNKSFNSDSKQEKPKASPFPFAFGDNLPKSEKSDDTQPKIHGVKTHRVGYDGKNRPNRH